MGGERLIVYLRPGHFPTDFCHFSNGPGRGKLSCNLAGKYCTGQSVLTLSCCVPACCCTGVQGQSLARHPRRQEGKETTAHASSIPDSQATSTAGYPCSRTEVTLKDKRLPWQQSLASWPYRSIRGRLWSQIIVWVENKWADEDTVTCCCLTSLWPQGRAALRQGHFYHYVRDRYHD